MEPQDLLIIQTRQDGFKSLFAWATARMECAETVDVSTALEKIEEAKAGRPWSGTVIVFVKDDVSRQALESAVRDVETINVHFHIAYNGASIPAYGVI